jgi:hypothetical protein
MQLNHLVKMFSGGYTHTFQALLQVNMTTLKVQ